jgi:hypothetical protein
MAERLWDSDSDGNVILCPLTDFEVIDYSGQSVLLRLEYRLRPGEPEESSRVEQLQLSPQQAVRLARGLLDKAGAAPDPRPAT